VAEDGRPPARKAVSRDPVCRPEHRVGCPKTGPASG